MNARHSALAALVALTTFAAARASFAEQAEVAVGASVTAMSSQVQADLELHRRIAFQLAVGQPLFFGERTVTAGGRLYLTRTFLAPYVGVLASHQTDHTFDGVPFSSDYAGPTFGLRLRGRRFGAFAEGELLQDRATHDRYLLPGVGLQYFF